MMQNTHNLFRLPCTGLPEDFWEKYPFVDLNRRVCAVRPEGFQCSDKTFYCRLLPVWTDSKIIVFFEVRCQGLVNNGAPDKLWDGDSLDFFFDMRENRIPSYTGKARHIIIDPPHPEPGNFSRIQEVGRRMPTRGTCFLSLYDDGIWFGSLSLTAEVLGCSSFHEGQTLYFGAQFIEFSVHRETKNTFLPQRLLRYPNTQQMINDPMALLPWTLTAEEPDTCRPACLSHTVNIEIPPLMQKEALCADFHLPPSLQERFKFWTFLWNDGKSETAFHGEQNCIKADLPACEPGAGHWTLVLEDSGHGEIGFLSGESFLYDGDRVRRDFEEADRVLGSVIPEPYLQVQKSVLAASVERVKRILYLRQSCFFEDALLILEKYLQFFLHPEQEFADPLFRLMRLSADPQTRTTVEYPFISPAGSWNRTAVIKVLYGGLLVAWAKCSLQDGEPEGCTAHPAVCMRCPFPEETIEFCGKKGYVTEPKRTDYHLVLSCGLKAVVSSVSAKAAEILTHAIREFRPLTADEHLRMRLALAEKLSERLPEKTVPYTQLEQFCNGDIHCHTMFSDGLPTPLEQVLHALYTGMDFLVISDHETGEGALALQKILRGTGLQDYLIPGQENTLNPWGHYNAYPLKRTLPIKRPLAEYIRDAAADDAVVQWNHPATFSDRTEWRKHCFPDEYRLVAWEHPLPLSAKNWKKRPPVTGSTDSHHTVFPLERTVVFMQTISGKVLAESVCQDKCAVYAPENVVPADGNPCVIAGLVSALQDKDGIYLKAHRERLAGFLRNTDFRELTKQSPFFAPWETFPSLKV